MSVVEEFAGIDVDDMLQLRRRNGCCCFLLFLHAFAYVFKKGLPSEFVVDSET